MDADVKDLPSDGILEWFFASPCSDLATALRFVSRTPFRDRLVEGEVVEMCVRVMSRFEFQAVSVMEEFGDQGMAFVRAGGLKPLFKCLMGRGKWGVKRDRRERSSVAVIWGLFKHTPVGEERKR